MNHSLTTVSLPEGDHIALMQMSDLDQVHSLESTSQQNPWSRQHFLDEFNNPVATIDLYWSRGTLAGFLCTWLIAGEMQVQNIATAPGMRRKGIAARLLEHAVSRCRTELTSICLEVRASNEAAIALYERFGFVVNGRRSGYYQDGEDALLMTCSLK